MAHRLFQVGIKALITNSDGYVLLLNAHAFKENAAHWDLPGGRIEDKQSPEDALCREIEEETGITEVDDIEFFSACISNFELDFDDVGKVGLVLMAYTVHIPENSTIVISDEHSEYEWVSRAEAADRLTYKYPKDFTDALNS